MFSSWYLALAFSDQSLLRFPSTPQRRSIRSGSVPAPLVAKRYFDIKFLKFFGHCEARAVSRMRHSAKAGKIQTKELMDFPSFRR
jgi:hypothetical protein